MAIDLELGGFKSSKSIHPNFSFKGTFTGITDAGIDISKTIQPWHIISVSYEDVSFKSDGQYMGMGILNTFPILDRSERECYNLTVKMEEDREGNVFSFIQYLRTINVQQNGVYNFLENIKGRVKFSLEVFTRPQKYTVFFEDMYFLNASAPEYAYGASDSIAYTLTFGYDNLSFKFE